ncbi:hypothetical protein KQR54_18325 [Mycobacterium gordonae]|nr:hypothetical protein [Mycobacterium gordonae]
MSERKLNGLFAKMSGAFKRTVTHQQTVVSAEIGKTRLQVVDIVASYAKNDDTISRSRLNALLRDLEGVEKDIRSATNRSLLTVMKDSADQAFSGVSGALKAVFGASVAAFSSAKVTASSFLSPLTGKSPTGKNIAAYLAERTGTDGLRLSDRVWNISADHRDAIGRILRRGILRGDSIARMTRDITEVYGVEDWKARRLVVTESNAAFRTAIGYEAERLDFVRGLRLQPGTKHSRACVTLAAEDRHGMGAGIFLPSDTDIYNPHPNCTSVLTFVLIDEEVR